MTDEGIVLSYRAHGESDKLVTLFTRDSGLITCLAKGAMKQSSSFGGKIEPTTKIQFLPKRAGAWTLLTQVREIEPNLSLKQNAFVLHRVFVVFEILRKFLPENRSDLAIYQMLGEFLAAFGQLSLTLDKQKGELVLLSFKHSLLLLEGMGIDSHFCEVCEEKRGEYLVENKGILCCDCKADQAGMEVGDLIPLLLQLEEPMQIVRRRNPLPQASFLRVKKMVETLFLQRTGLQLLSEKMLMH